MGHLKLSRDCPTNGIVGFYSAILRSKDADRITNRVDTDQTAPRGAVWSGSALFAQTYLSQYFKLLRYSGLRLLIEIWNSWNWLFLFHTFWPPYSLIVHLNYQYIVLPHPPNWYCIPQPGFWKQAPDFDWFLFRFWCWYPNIFTIIIRGMSSS